MATRVTYQCPNCKCTAHVQPPTCWYCGHTGVQELLVYSRPHLPDDLQQRMKEVDARVKLDRWNRKVRGE